MLFSTEHDRILTGVPERTGKPLSYWLDQLAKYGMDSKGFHSGLVYLRDVLGVPHQDASAICFTYIHPHLVPDPSQLSVEEALRATEDTTTAPGAPEPEAPPRKATPKAAAAPEPAPAAPARPPRTAPPRKRAAAAKAARKAPRKPAAKAARRTAKRAAARKPARAAAARPKARAVKKAKTAARPARRAAAGARKAPATRPRRTR